MANPITWRNVDAARLGESLRPMYAAQQGIDSGFDRLSKVYDQYEQGVKDANTQNFLNELAKYRTPEALQAAQASGLLDRMRERAGYQINSDAVRNAEATQLSGLYKQAGDAAAYKDLQAAPTRDALAKILYTQGEDAFKQALNEHPDLPGQGTLAKAGFDFHGVLDERNRKAAQDTRAKESHELAQKLNKANVDKAVETARLADVDKNLKSLASQHNQNVIKGEEALSTMARNMGYPLTSSGTPDMAAINADPVMRDVWAKAAPEYLKMMGIPEEVSDTTAKEKAIRSLLDAGKMRPGDEFAFNATDYFDSRRPLVGKDAAIAKARQEDFAANSTVAPGSSNAIRNQDTLADFITKTIKNPKEHDQAQAMVAKLASEGFKTPNGTVIPYPQEVLKNAVLRSQEGWLGAIAPGNYRDWDIEAQAKKLMNDPKLIEELQKKGTTEQFKSNLLNAKNKK